MGTDGDTRLARTDRNRRQGPARCYFCLDMGHMSRDCRYRSNSPNFQPPSDGARYYTNPHMSEVRAQNITRHGEIAGEDVEPYRIYMQQVARFRRLPDTSSSSRTSSSSTDTRPRSSTNQRGGYGGARPYNTYNNRQGANASSSSSSSTPSSNNSVNNVNVSTTQPTTTIHTSSVDGPTLTYVASALNKDLCKMLKGSVFITVHGQDRLCSTLLDTGAPHTIISHQLVKRLKLEHRITPPNADVIVTLADPKHRVARIGRIQLDITVHFPYTHRPSVTMTKEFEIMNASYDFLLGADTLPTLFPNDEIMIYLMPISPLGSMPIVPSLDLTTTAQVSATDRLQPPTHVLPTNAVFSDHEALYHIHSIASAHQSASSEREKAFKREVEAAEEAFKRLSVNNAQGAPTDAASSSSQQ